MTTTLVIGGTPGETSRHAAHLLRRHEQVTVVVTRPPGVLDDDRTGGQEGTQRGRRPAGWRTVETLDLTRALLGARNPVLVDCLLGWLQGQIEAQQLADDPAAARRVIGGLAEEMAVAARALPFEVVLVSRDLAPLAWSSDPHDRQLHALLAQVNERLSAAATTVHVVVAGRVLDLSSAPPVGR